MLYLMLENLQQKNEYFSCHLSPANISPFCWSLDGTTLTAFSLIWSSFFYVSLVTLYVWGRFQFEFSLNVFIGFTEFSDKYIYHYSKGLEPPSHLLCKRPACYHCASKTHVRHVIFQLSAIHASVIVTFPQFAEFSGFLFHLVFTEDQYLVSDMYPVSVSFRVFPLEALSPCFLLFKILISLFLNLDPTTQ